MRGHHKPESTAAKPEALDRPRHQLSKNLLAILQPRKWVARVKGFEVMPRLSALGVGLPGVKGVSDFLQFSCVLPETMRGTGRRWRSIRGVSECPCCWTRSCTCPWPRHLVHRAGGFQNQADPESLTFCDTALDTTRAQH